jgi:hypothetical protein
MTIRCELVIYHQRNRDLQPILIQLWQVCKYMFCEGNFDSMFEIPFSSRVIGYALDAANGVKRIGEGTPAL